MKLQDIKPAIKTDVMIFEKSEKRNMHLSTKVENIDYEKEEIWILTPIKDSRPYPISEGSEADLLLIINEIVYTVFCKVIGSVVIGNIPITKLRKIGNIKDVQRRENYRLKGLLPIKYSKSSSGKSVGPTYSTFANDISGNGMKIRVKEKIKNGHEIICEFSLNEKSNLRVVARIVWCEDCSNDSEYKYELGLIFENIKRGIQEEIIKYIFIGQRKLLKKG